MALPADSPFRTSREERRAVLARRFVAVMPALLEHASYSDLSVATIIKAGSISRASFYRYFQDKSELLLEMIQHVTEDLLGAGDEWWDLPVTATKEELVLAHRRIVDVYRRHRLLLRSVVEGAGYDPSLRAAYAELVATSVDNVARHIEDGQREGFITPDLVARPTAELLVYMGERSLYQIVGLEHETDDARYPDPLAEIYWRTLYEGYRLESGGIA